MADIKDTAQIAAKWARVTPQRAEDYRLGVESPRRDWQQATIAAAGRYAAGVQAALQNKLYEKGVNRATSQKWQRRALELGPARFAQGVSASGDAYQTGYEPYRQTIANLRLPPRGPAGDPRNLDRVAAVAKALHDRKLAG